MLVRAAGGFVVGIALSCSAPSAPRVAAPAASSRAAAAPSASPPADEPPPRKSRKQEQHDAIDRLMGGALGRAEQGCAGVAEADREACIDAALADHDKQLDAEMASSSRMLVLLEQYGESRCKSQPSTMLECRVAAINALVVELGKDCPSTDDEARQHCLVGQVLKRLGP